MSKYIFKAYVNGQKHARMVERLRRIFDQHIPGNYDFIVIDILSSPELVEADNIIATPTLLKLFPPPPRRIIGDLSDDSRVLNQIMLEAS